ncbi:MAG: mannosyltransferase YkcB-related protein [Solirubrobacteraceae bacterium]
MTALWAHALLGRTPSFEPWLRAVVLPVGLLAAAALLLAPSLGRRATLAAVLPGILASLAGPVVHAVETVTTSHTGSLVSAGPASAGGGLGGGPGGRGFPGGPGTGGGSFGGAGGAPGGGAGGAPGGGAGGDTTISAALAKALQSGAGGYRWAAAASGSQSAADLELASGEPVMAIGGFNGEGGNLTLAQFESYVEKGQIHYYGAGAGMGAGPGRGGSASQIGEWVEKHFKSLAIGGQKVYDLTAGSG